MIAGIVLAAGASRRMGRPKALLPTGTGDETFVCRLVGTLQAGGVREVVVVTRPGLPLDRAFEAMRLPPTVVENPEPEGGQLSSLLTALAVVDRPDLRGVLVATVDQPFVSPATVTTLLDAYRKEPARIVRPESNGRHGHPVIFERALFDDLRRTDLAGGAKSVVHANAAFVRDVRIEDEGAYVDIDTPADYVRVTGRPFPGA